MEKLNRSQLVELITQSSPHLGLDDVNMAISAILDCIADALASGRRVEVRGMGTFSVRQTKARLGRNPKSGEAVFIPSRARVHFKPGKELRTRVMQNKD